MPGRRGPAVVVEGGPQLRRALRRMGDGLDDLKDAHHDAGELVADEARAIVPVDEGALQGSIRANRRANGADVLAGSARVPYAGPIHFGWAAHGIEPDPFLYDALDRRRDAVRDAYDKGVSDLVRRFDREAP